MALRDLKEWKDDFANRSHVQPDEHSRSLEGAYLNGESAVVVSGPPQLGGSFTPAQLLPVGLVQSAQISQNKQLNQLFEIGGRDAFFIPGRSQVRAQLSRILFDGPSLFYALYQRSYSTDGQGGQVPSPANFGSGSISALNNPTMPYGESGNARSEDGNLMDVQRPDDQQEADPGLFWSNLGSALFNRPLGLGFVLYDMEGEPYGGTYLEKCYIRSHSFGISANATVLAENVALAATRVRPLSAKNFPG